MIGAGEAALCVLVVVGDRLEEIVRFFVVHFCVGEPDGVFVVPV